MFDTFREPNFFTFSVIFSHIASIFTFSVDFFFTFSYLFTYSGIFTFEGATSVCDEYVWLISCFAWKNFLDCVTLLPYWYTIHNMDMV